MTTRLLLDETYPVALAESLRDKGHDVHAVVGTSDLAGQADSVVLEVATAAQRCVVTENVRDFALLTRYSGHAGVLFVAAARWPRSRAVLPRLANALHELVSDGLVPGPNEVRWLS